MEFPYFFFFFFKKKKKKKRFKICFGLYLFEFLFFNNHHLVIFPWCSWAILDLN